MSVVFYLLLLIQLTPYHWISQESARIGQAIRDLDSTDEERKKDAAYLIYQFSTKQVQPDLIIPALVNQLKNKEKYKSTFGWAVSSLPHYGKLPTKYLKDVIPVAIANLEDPEPSIRFRLSEIINNQGRPALPFVLVAFSERTGDTGKAALIDYFSSVGPDASAAVPLLLTDLKKRPKSEGRICATIADIDCENEVAASFFLRRIDDKKVPDFERQVWAHYLARNSKHGKKVERYLARGLQTKDEAQKVKNLIAMWHIKDLTESKDQIRQVFDDERNEDVRLIAAAMLVRINKSDTVARKVLIRGHEITAELIKLGNWEHRLIGIWITQELGDKSAIMKLRVIANEDYHRTVREFARAAVKEIEERNK